MVWADQKTLTLISDTEETTGETTGETIGMILVQSLQVTKTSDTLVEEADSRPAVVEVTESSEVTMVETFTLVNLTWT